MTMIKHTATTMLLFMLLTLAACVTINVYFPAAQAERAAERIVDEILGEPQKKAEPDSDKDAYLWRDIPLQALASIGHLLINDAQAAQPDFSVNTPEIRRLQSNMADRNKQLTPYYNSGAIGFDRNGLIAIHDQGALSLKQRGSANSLITAENRDRKALYQAIAKANGHPEWENDVRVVFAKKWTEKARKGWWYQTPDGVWQQK
ncbi:MAG: YdbL family protein [Chromatiales bacterium]|jgi:uncharacterized protein YdbL (DUF1318 family)